MQIFEMAVNKYIYFSLFLFMSFESANAQKGNNSVSINAEATIPSFQDDHGFGGFAKGLYGVGGSAQLTLSIGFSKFRSNDSVDAGKVETSLIPFLFGYKQNIKKFFIEPKIGLGELGGKIPLGGDYSRPSITALFGGLSTGYAFHRLSIGIAFLASRGIDNASAGIWHDEKFHYTSVFVGYDLFSKTSH